ncbi:aminotransferase class V-fold PLP-dependent enzyme [Sphingobium sufflavum]|uniref:cysteine desulfurase family protein n=1 Tax=Sphingobium sufflavum TaxID=1129547 RepID=UPI001F424281|nr:aminotransferase class V-fold PLP-dependent enzyme [Sphingobium sufflavum]MCE7797492.1 aminotransferase class V-fold PLP-dependent enzyme [Sphingobium sufflavum]
MTRANPLIYLDHAATTPVLPVAREAVIGGLDGWANPSSPHAAGRRAKAALEEARARIAAALGWGGSVVLTGGASEAIAIALRQAKAARRIASATEHDSVLRHIGHADRLAVDSHGLVGTDGIDCTDALVAIQHVNSETGVIQPVDAVGTAIRRGGGLWLCDCAQSAGKLPLPDADFIAIGAHKLGGPVGVGALLVRDLARLNAGGGQELGYRGGTENLPAILGMAAALEDARDWLVRAAALRATLDAAIRAMGGEVVAGDAARIATIASYRMPGVSARAQLIRFDGAGIAVSAGSACSSGTLKTSPVLAAMGWDEGAAAAVVRVSFGWTTTSTDVEAFIAQWRRIAGI